MRFKRLFSLLLAACLVSPALAGCGSESREATSSGQTTPSGSTDEEADGMPDEIFLTIGGHKIAVRLEKNAATAALVALLKEGAITYTADEYGGFEKVGVLGHSLPRSDTQMTTAAGDVILYGGDRIVLFYGSNSWSYTRLGKMQGYSAEEIGAILTATDPITVTIGLR